MGLLLGVLALPLLLFGLIGLVIGPPVWAAGLLIGGVVLLMAASALGLGEIREVIKRDSTRRGAKYGGNALLQTLIVGVILGLLAFVSVRNSVRWDWTEAKIHSLTQATLDVLAEISEGQVVEILAFYVAGGQAAGKDAVELYGNSSERLRVKVVDPNRDPALANRWEIRSEGVLIVCGGSCDEAQGTVRVDQASEEELTKAIRSVISERKKVYFLSGHGEGDPESEQAEGFSLAKTSLSDENIEVESLILANIEDVPEDADALIVAGPDHSLIQRELEAMDRYLRAGGGVMILVDPIVVTRLEDQVRAWGIELGNDLIVDQQIQLFAGPQLGVQPVVTSYGPHPVTEKFAGGSQPTLFQMSRSVRASEDADAEIVELAMTGSGSWAESDVELFVRESKVGIGAEDRRGPVAVAAARSFAVEEEGGREGRLVVVGDSDFARNRYIAEFYNRDLLLNAVNWLVGEEQFISIERKTPRASRVVMSAAQVANFRALATLGMPLVILLAGIVSWWLRRRI